MSRKRFNREYKVQVVKQVLEEAKSKRNCAYEKQARLSGFPIKKTLAKFDFSFQPFIGKRRNIVFLGPPGVGKAALGLRPPGAVIPPTTSTANPRGLRKLTLKAGCTRGCGFLVDTDCSSLMKLATCRWIFREQPSSFSSSPGATKDFNHLYVKQNLLPVEYMKQKQHVINTLFEHKQQ